MAKVEFDLEHGVEVGSQLEKHVVLRELTAGDLIEINQESERAVVIQGEPSLVISPTLSGALSMCHQVAKLGSIDGPIELSVLSKMHVDDFTLMQVKTAELQAAGIKAMEDLSNRGRTEGDSEGS